MLRCDDNLDVAGKPFLNRTKYSYDGQGWRISEAPAGGTATDLYYSSQWQVLEERQSGNATAQNVWGITYFDQLVLRDRDADQDASHTLEERLYALQDANENVTAIITTSGAVAERYVLDPYGVPSVRNADWSVKGTGTVSASTFGWVYLHQGGRYDVVAGEYIFRHRDYSPTMMRWGQQDAMGYVDGPNAYSLVGDNPLTYSDPSGATRMSITVGAFIPARFGEWLPEPLGSGWEFHTDNRGFGGGSFRALGMIAFDARDVGRITVGNSQGLIFSYISTRRRPSARGGFQVEHEQEKPSGAVQFKNTGTDETTWQIDVSAKYPWAPNVAYILAAVSFKMLIKVSACGVLHDAVNVDISGFHKPFPDFEAIARVTGRAGVQQLYRFDTMAPGPAIRSGSLAPWSFKIFPTVAATVRNVR